jgi:hypothetical protein
VGTLRQPSLERWHLAGEGARFPVNRWLEAGDPTGGHPFAEVSK